MTDAIRPALTPEEWEAFGRSPDGWPKLPRYAHADDGPWLMACANHALPDGHPNKFTRADVDLIMEMLSAIDTDNTHYDHDALDRGARSLAARIEALLPPECDDDLRDAFKWDDTSPPIWGPTERFVEFDVAPPRRPE